LKHFFNLTECLRKPAFLLCSRLKTAKFFFHFFYKNLLFTKKILACNDANTLYSH